MNKVKVIAVVGPTASGKTNLARFLAEQYNGEIVSADSRQVYRGLDIGTGKEGEVQPNTTGSALADHYPTLRYLGQTPQWLIDIVEPTETYTVADWQRDARTVVEDIIRRNKTPIIAGGTGLYVSALLEGYDFTQPAERDPQNPRHSSGQNYKKSPPDWNVLVIGIDLPREELYQRIDSRLDQRIDQGLIEEGHQLIMRGVTTDHLRSFGLEYRYLADLISGQLTEAEFRAQLKFAIHRYARRQLTWWRHHGQIEWIIGTESARSLMGRFLR